MRLVSFTVENYRSITKARKIGAGDTTVLIGPNNEGKSNILRALVAGMYILTRGNRLVDARGVTSRLLFHERQVFDWDRDFPLHLQETHPDGRSVVILEFGLTPAEVQEFRDKIGSALTRTLPLRIEIGRRDATVKVAKQGRGSQRLSKKSGSIGQFVAERLDFEHIAAVRTASSAKRVVDQLVERELRTLEDNPQYRAALASIAELQRPILDQLSASMRSTLATLLPAVRDLRIEINSEVRHRALLRTCDVVVDDGAATLLEYKGDGVQSLAAIGIMRHASEKSGSLRNLVIAIEEPESHLHPKAIHELRDVLAHLAEKHQVVLTTHCPLFVNRASLSSNVLVHNNRARPARSIREIREILGVRASDNLRHAELVLLVEGEDDRVTVEPLLRHSSRELRSALDAGALAIDWLSGGTNLAYKAGLIREALCSVHCFLDDDKAGRDGFEKAKAEGVLSDGDANFATCQGRNEAEIEDMYDPAVYAGMVNNVYHVQIASSKFRSARKWSDRMRETFRAHGKLWNDRVEMDLKRRVADLVAANPATALKAECRSALDGLIYALEQRLHALGDGRQHRG